MMGQSIFVVEIASDDEWKSIGRTLEMTSDEEREIWRAICESPHSESRFHTPWHDCLGETFEECKRPNDLSLVPECLRVALEGAPNRFCYLA